MSFQRTGVYILEGQTLIPHDFVQVFRRCNIQTKKSNNSIYLLRRLYMFSPLQIDRFVQDSTTYANCEDFEIMQLHHAYNGDDKLFYFDKEEGTVTALKDSKYATLFY